MATIIRNRPPEGPRTIPIDREQRTKRTFGGFLKCVRDSRNAQLPADRYMAQQRLEKEFSTEYVNDRLSVVTKTVMGENVGSLGGYLVPQDLTLELLECVAEESFIYPRAHVIPMMSPKVLAPTVDVTTIQATGTSPFFGGVRFRWGSSQAPGETEPTFRQVQINAWDLLGYATVSNDFLSDIGSGGEDYLVRLFGKAAAWCAEFSFLRGTGTAQAMPLGILNAPALISLTRQTASQITQVDVAGMASLLIPFSWRNAIWACSPSALAQLMRVTGYQMNMDHLDAGSAGVLLTRPLYVTEKLPALGTKGDLILFDPSLYAVGVRQEVLVDVSPHVAFQSNQTDFRVWLRVDGRPQVSSGVTLADGTTVASPYIALN